MFIVLFVYFLDDRCLDGIPVLLWRPGKDILVLGEVHTLLLVETVVTRLDQSRLRRMILVLLDSLMVIG